MSEDLGVIFKRIQTINSDQEKENEVILKKALTIWNVIMIETFQDQEVIRSKIDDLQGKFKGIRRYAGTK